MGSCSISLVAMIGPKCVEYSVSIGTFLPGVHIKKSMRGRYRYYHLARINAPGRTQFDSIVEHSCSYCHWHARTDHANKEEAKVSPRITNGALVVHDSSFIVLDMGTMLYPGRRIRKSRSGSNL